VIQSVKEAADIYQTVSQHVALKRAGAQYKGLCPFHQEKTPSFTIDQTRGTYHCFGCGEHGDSITFLTKVMQMSFPEAVRHLADQLGIMVPEEEMSPAQRQQKKKRKSLSELHDQLVSWYEESLKRSPLAQRYLQDREISRESAEAFRLGWAASDVELFSQWMERTGASVKELLEIGALRPAREGEREDPRIPGAQLRFKNRLVCPIFDIRGRSIGFSGRVINPRSKAPKYLNTGETELFTKGRSLYGLDTAREATRRSPDQPLIICEGNLDVVSLWQAGFRKAVAPMGTALTEEQARLMRRLSDQVIVLMDGDAAGEKAAFKSLPILIKEGLKARSCTLPEGEDPDSFLKKNGPQAMRALLDEAPPLFERYVRHLVSQHTQDSLGQAAVTKLVLPLVLAERDEHLRPLYLNQVAELTGLDRAYLTDQLKLAHESVTSTETHGGGSQRSVVRSPEGTFDEARYDDFQGWSAPALEEPPTARSHPGDSKHRSVDQKARSWWELESEKLRLAEQEKRFGGKARRERINGAIDIKTKDERAPFEPLMGEVTRVEGATLPGYEREGIQLLYYHPQLIAQVIERGASQLWGHPLVTRFIDHLYERYRHSGYVASARWLDQHMGEHPSVAIAIRESLAAPPPQMSSEDLMRALNSVINSLIERRLKGDYQRSLIALREARARSQDAPQGEPSDALSSALERYNQAREALKRLKGRGARSTQLSLPVEDAS